ncbi:MAG: hypothetical protein AAGE59_17685 [Cyanobacteria bacterium P01_F01_bin.86]
MILQTKLNQVIRVGLIITGTSLLLITSTPIAQAQSTIDPGAIRRELGLNRSQMRQLRDIMQDYQAELEDILTPEQLEEMQDLREASQQDGTIAESERPSGEDIIAELDLNEDQVEQLEQTRESLKQDLETVLTPEQIEKLEEMAGI